MKVLIVLAAVLGLAGCETQATYAPAPTARAFGYSDAAIKDGRWRITFRAAAHADPGRVENMALLRAAELTLKQGSDWFIVTDRFDETRDEAGVRSASHVGFGRRTAVGLRTGYGIDRTGGPMIARTLVIVIGRGPAPTAANVYGAWAVRRTLGPHV